MTSYSIADRCQFSAIESVLIEPELPCRNVFAESLNGKLRNVLNSSPSNYFTCFREPKLRLTTTARTTIVTALLLLRLPDTLRMHTNLNDNLPEFARAQAR